MKIENTFLDLLNLDTSDLAIKRSMIRSSMNIRVVDLDASSYAITNIRGTELGFTLTAGYRPIATKQFDNVMYILSINPATSVCEIGSFGSPDYVGDALGENSYRPLNNLGDGGIDEPHVAVWGQTGSGAVWSGSSVTLATAGTNSKDKERAVSLLGSINHVITYQGAIYNVGGSAATAHVDFNFYNAINTLIYSKTFSYSGTADLVINTTETVAFSELVTKVKVRAYKDTGSAPLVYSITLLNVLPAVGVPFRTSIFGYNVNSFVKMELQPEYDGSINVLLFEKNNPPRIVNTKFLRNGNGALEVAPTRPGTASTNVYTTLGMDEQTKLILTTDTILQIALAGITSGGKVKYGTYRYYFAYMTQDFNTTEIVGQSGLCAAFSGVDFNTLKGGTSTQETDKRISLSLTNIDTTFRYLKVFVLYSSGQEGLQQQMLEFVTPLEITSSTMTFYHTGFEKLTEIDADAVNTSFQMIDAAASGTQVNGFLLLGGIKENSVDFNDFRSAAQQVTSLDKTVNLPYSTSLSALGGYADVNNIYNYVGLFGGEAYPYAIVFILPGGRLTPPFPIQGRDSASDNIGTAVLNNQGIYRAPLSNLNTFFTGTNFVVRGVTFNIASIPGAIKTASIGFFIVRAERNPNLITQGYFFPVLRVPPIEFLDSNATYYNRFQLGNEALYKMVPCVDGYLEAYEMDTATGGGDLYVLDVNNNYKLLYYMPIVINHFGPSSADSQPSGDNMAGYINNFPTDHWAFISAESLANEPDLISKIAQREGMKCLQLGKVNFNVIGNIAPLPTTALAGSTIDHADTASIGLFYDAQSVAMYTLPTVKTVDLSEYVPAESLATGSVFASKVATRFKVANTGGGTAFGVYLNWNSYFGMKVQNLADISYISTNPQGGNSRIPSAKFNPAQESSYFAYSNYLTGVNAAFIVNIYPGGGVDTSGNLTSVSSLYPDVDSLIYKQVGKRYTWADAGSSIDVFDGDCYIVRAFHKMYQSGFRDPASPLAIRNIDAGTLVSVIQQSRFNTNLRNPTRYDASEFQDRSFYPYQSKGDFSAFRRYRFPEAITYSPGYSPDLGPKSFIPISALSPAIRSDFFSRISVSSRHIPNAFQNGYRNFAPNAFHDYDSSMGRIVDVLNHKGQLLVVFEHGVGLMPIEERILVGQDSAGPVYARTSNILPATMSFPSRQLGCQHPRSIVQTPSAVYGVDVEKRKIWQFRDRLEVISDGQISSFIDTSNLGGNPRSGYNFKYNEVVFTTDYWTFCFREGVEKFVTPYSFKPWFYGSRGGEFYSFPLTGFGGGFPNFQLHDSPASRSIYGQQEDCFIEFTVPVVPGPDGKPSTNVYDFIEIFSNEVSPYKVEFFTYKDSRRPQVVDMGNLQQYSHVGNVVDFFTEEAPIHYRDKRFIVQIPPAEVYNGPLDNWAAEGRMRNKYLIVRLSYSISDALQLLSIITTFRQSKS